MTALLIDIGNTRLKWAVMRRGKLGRMRAVPHARQGRAVDALVRAAPRDTARVLVVSVGGEKLDRALAAALRKKLGIRPEFMRSARSSFGVRNGYRDVWRLGADRWVAVVGARDLAPGRAVLVASVGTALTVDAVSAGGRHAGGAIVPAPVTMIRSLLEGTDGIARRARGGAAPAKRPIRKLWAADTAGGLAAGAVFAGAAFIDRAVAEATRALGARPTLILTGGAARALRPHIKSAARLMPDLVLRGLAVFARG